MFRYRWPDHVLGDECCQWNVYGELYWWHLLCNGEFRYRYSDGLISGNVCELLAYQWKWMCWYVIIECDVIGSYGTELYDGLEWNGDVVFRIFVIGGCQWYGYDLLPMV